MLRGSGLGVVFLLLGSTASGPERIGTAPRIGPNDNRVPAGRLHDGVLSIDLVAGEGEWFPWDSAGPGRVVYAFGEAGQPLMNPGPMLRVPAGTEIRVTVVNTIGAATLTVHGLHDRPGEATPLSVPAGDRASVRFRVHVPGTYYYWGTTRNARTLRERWGMESQLVGAFIVDPPEGSPPDHVLVLGVEDGPGALPAQRAIEAAAVNGRSWPYGRMFDVPLGDTVRMRWINTTDRPHPMHLHGSYFTVTAKGDIATDTVYDAAARRLAVTELMAQGQTFSLEWIAERPGNWLMHCHMTEHMSPPRHGAVHVTHHAGNHALDGMSGLVTGWRVSPGGGEAAPVDTEAVAARSLRLLVQSSPGRYGDEPGIGFVLQNGGAPPRADSVAIPGEPLILTRGEPVRITVVNRLREPTAIHWHGMELDSYYDGVAGWSGGAGRLSPPIAAGDSFEVRFTPPRAGTFIHHSHFDEERQLALGLYGPLIVLEPGERYDPETDRVWLLSQSGPAPERPLMLNGARSPELSLQVNRRYRIRLINIHSNLPVVFSLLADSVPVRWRAIAKDGAALPAAQARVGPAMLRIGVGETYDFEYSPAEVGTLRIRSTDPGGVERLTGVVRILPAPAVPGFQAGHPRR